MRNTITITLALLCICAASLTAEDGFVSMFNGKDLTGWKGRPDLWSVQDAAITGTTTEEAPIKSNTFLIWEGGQPGDFELVCKFRISDQGNSGIQYRSKILDEKEFVVGGYQADIDASLKFAGICYEEKGDGILCQRGEVSTVHSKQKIDKKRFAESADLGAKIKKGEWNDYRIVAIGNKLQHFINGALMSEVHDLRPDGKSASKGIIALQVHRGPPMRIQFKDMKIKVL